MRHRIEIYRDLKSGSAFFAVTMVTGFMALVAAVWGFGALLDPLVSNGYGWALTGIVPGAINGILAMTHINRGLDSLYRRSLLDEYYKMPKSMRDEMPLSRQDVVMMSNDDCRSLESSIKNVMRRKTRDIDGAFGRSKRYLDSLIETYDELGVK